MNALSGREPQNQATLELTTGFEALGGFVAKMVQFGGEVDIDGGLRLPSRVHIMTEAVGVLICTFPVPDLRPTLSRRRLEPGDVFFGSRMRIEFVGTEDTDDGYAGTELVVEAFRTTSEGEYLDRAHIRPGHSISVITSTIT